MNLAGKNNELMAQGWTTAMLIDCDTDCCDSDDDCCKGGDVAW